MNTRLLSVAPTIAGAGAVLALSGCAAASPSSSATSTMSDGGGPPAAASASASAQRVEAEQQCYSLTDALWLSTRDFNTAPILITGMGDHRVTDSGECRVEILNVDHYLTVTVTYDDFSHALVLSNKDGRVVVPIRG